MTWILFALGAQIFWAIVNIIDKILNSKFIKNSLDLSIAASAVDALVGIIIWIIFGFYAPSPIVLLLAVGIGVIRTAAFTFYYKALSLEEVSIVTILFQINPIFVLLISYLFLAENLSNLNYLAFIFLFLAGILASLKIQLKKIRLSPAFWIVIADSFLVAVSVVLIKYVYKFDSFIHTWPWMLIGNGFGALALAAIFKRKINQVFYKLSHNAYYLLIVMGILGALGLGSFNYAISIGSPTMVNAIGATNPLFVFLIALILSIYIPKVIKENVDYRTIVLKFCSLILASLGIIILSGIIK